MKRRQYKLLGDTTLAVVPGPKPYLWVGDVGGVPNVAGVTTNTTQLRNIWNAIGQALREAEQS